MNVSACLVTRGDVDMQPILDSLPAEWERVVWDNGAGVVTMFGSEIRWLLVKASYEHASRSTRVSDLAVYGRYAAIEYASHDLIYVQDDDVIVPDPQAIVQAWHQAWACTCEATLISPGVYGEPRGRLNPICSIHGSGENGVVCNMPQEFRPHYPDSGLVGFGAAFHRDAPDRAFSKFAPTPGYWSQEEREAFHRRADNVFTTLTPRVLVDVAKHDLPYASDDNRMWRQDSHVGERDRFIQLARAVRDAG